jgi:hypothetical protein
MLRAYFDFTEGRPTAESVAEKLDLPLGTVKKWLADERNAKFLDQVVPLWPNIGGARQYATSLVPEALEVIAETMRGRNGAKPKDQLEAARFLLALAGVRPTDQAAEKEEAGERKRPAVLLNLFVGGSNGEQSIRVVDGTARELADTEERSLSPELSANKPT